VALDRIPPPLNILQGFEIRSADGLANVIDRINRTFDFAFDTRVSAEEYARVFADSAGGEAPGLEGVSNIELKFELPPLPSEAEARAAELRPRVEALAASLRRHGLGMITQKDLWRSWGEGFKLEMGSSFTATMDPWVHARLIPALRDVGPALGAPPDAPAELTITFRRDSFITWQLLRESLLLGRVGVLTVGEREYVHERVRFSLSPWHPESDAASRYLTIETTVDAVASIPLSAIVAKVAEAGLLGPASARGQRAAPSQP
jgi:hypothetical protein